MAELDSLIQRIKEEGIEEAKRESKDIIDEAQKKAEWILQEAQKEKGAIIKDAQKEAASLKESGKEALRQAARDLLLLLRQRIIELFDTVVKRDISDCLSGRDLKDIIVKTIESFKKEEGLDIEVLLSKKDKDELEGALLKSLKEEFKRGVTFKVSNSVEKGFRIGEKGRNFYYDFTDEAIAEAFGLYLNPKIAQIIKLKN